MWGIKVDAGSHSHDAVCVQARMRRKVVILDVGQVDAVANTGVLIDVASVLRRQPTELCQNDSNVRSDDGQTQEISSDRTRVRAKVLHHPHKLTFSRLGNSRRHFRLHLK